MLPYLQASIKAARQNLLLYPSLAPLAPFTHHSFHYIFSAAIAVVVQSFLPNETTTRDDSLVAQAIRTLTQLGMINESAESCSKMVRDLSIVVENVRMVRDGTKGELAELSFSPQKLSGIDIQYWSA